MAEAVKGGIAILIRIRMVEIEGIIFGNHKKMWH
jgi:hypothetical protein